MHTTHMNECQVTLTSSSLHIRICCVKKPMDFYVFSPTLSATQCLSPCLLSFLFSNFFFKSHAFSNTLAHTLDKKNVLTCRISLLPPEYLVKDRMENKKRRKVKVFFVRL